MHSAAHPWHRFLGVTLRLGFGFVLVVATGLMHPALPSAPGFAPLARAAEGETALADPLPLRRIVLPPQRIPAELARVQQGVLVRLARKDFEERVARAARAGLATENPPRLAETHYRASLRNAALIGTARWTIVNPLPDAGILPIHPLNLALRQARLGDAEAVVGELDGKTLGLLVETPGRHVLSLDWSARGEATPAGIHFDVRVPGCALASLELELPADRTVTVARELCLLSGPHPSGDPEHRRWQLTFSGQTQVDLVIQHPRSPQGVPPVVLAGLQSRQRLTPGMLEAEFEYQSLEVVHGAVQELVFACDPPLSPVEVQIANFEIENWAFRKGVSPEEPGTLTVRFHEPVRRTLPPLLIKCRAPLGMQVKWSCPRLRLVGGIPRGESLRLRISRDLRIADWDAGDYQLVNVQPDGDDDYLLTLAVNPLSNAAPDKGNGAAEGLPEPAATLGRDSGTRQRPSARFALVEPATRVRQYLWWQIGPQGTSLTAQMTCEVIRGQLFSLPILLPTGWEIERLEISPAELAHTWSVVPDEDGRATLLVEFPHPPALRTPLRLMVALRHLFPGRLTPVPQGTDHAETALSFPNLVPLDAGVREGALAISVDPLYKASVDASVAPAPADAVDRDDDRPLRPEARTPLADARSSRPWDSRTPDYYFPYRGQAVTGTLHLTPRPHRVRLECSTDVIVAAARTTCRVRLTLEPEVGAPEAVELHSSVPVEGEPRWQTIKGQNQVTRAYQLGRGHETAPLLGLGSVTAVQAVPAMALGARGAVWRLHFARPLREAVTLETTFDLPRPGLARLAALPLLLPPASPFHVLVQTGLAHILRQPPPPLCRLAIPLLAVVGAGRSDGHVTVHVAGPDAVHPETTGLQEINRSPAKGGVQRSAYRYSQPPFALTLIGGAELTERRVQAVARDAQLTTYVESPGQLLHHFRFEVRNWAEQTLPITLVPTAQVVAARIDGRWSPHLRVGITQDANVRVDLPVAGGSAASTVELIYRTERPSWLVWTRLRAPVPSLPLLMLEVRRTWFLPPDQVPLWDTSFVRLPSGTRGTAPGRGVAFTFLAKPLSQLRFPSSLGTEWSHAEPVIVDLQSRLPVVNQGDKALCLGDALAVLETHALLEFGPFVVDSVALRDAGLAASTDVTTRTEESDSATTSGPLRIPRAPGGDSTAGETSRLVGIRCRAGLLLTTQQQLEAWRQSESVTGLLGAAEEALESTTVYGVDVSGRFALLANWLEREPIAPLPGRSLHPPDLFRAGLAPSWSGWEPVGLEQQSPDEIVIVRRNLPLGLALALTLGLCAALWGLRGYSPRWTWAVLVAGVSVGWVLLLWLPSVFRVLAWWPGMAVALFVVLLCVRTTTKVMPSSRNRSSSIVTAGVLLLLSLALASQAGGPDSVIVWLVPAPGNEPAEETVLATPELLDQLDALSRRGANVLQAPIVLSARYDGAVARTGATFRADMQVYSFTNDPVTLTLGLSGVELGEMLVDGAEAYPVVLAPPRIGYGVRLKGRGLHVLQLRFTAALPALTEDGELRLAIPEVPRNHLRLQLPRDARHVQAVSSRGAAQLDESAEGVRLVVDLGRVNLIHVRWRQESESSSRPQMEVTESYFWDLHRSASRLLGLLQYHVSRGSITRIAIELPEPLEARGVETGPLPDGAAVPRLREWFVQKSGARRELVLEFAAPIISGVQVALELVPRQALTESVELLLPMPREAQPAERAGFLAFRTRELEAAEADWRRVTGMNPAPFRQAWLAAGLEDPGLPQHAYSFRRGPGSAPYLRLHLQAPVRRWRCGQELSWRLSPHHAEVHLVAGITSSDKDLAMLEWDCPPEVILVDVTGADVRSWSREGARLQVWLERPVAQTSLELSGWLPLPQQGAADAFRLPCLRPTSASTQVTMVRLSAESGSILRTLGLRNLLALPNSRPSARHAGFISTSGDYGGSFRVDTGNPTTAARVLTFVEARDRGLAVTTIIDCETRGLEPTSLALRLRDWDGFEAQIEAPAAIRRREIRRDGTTRTLVFDLEPRASGTMQIRFRGSLPLASAGEISVPDVSIEGDTAERWVVVCGPDLELREARGLTGPAQAPQALRRWPGEAERLRRAGGTAWRIESEAWGLRLRPRQPPITSPVEVLFAEQAAAVLDGQRWTHQASYWLVHETGAALGVRLPEGTEVLGVAVDGNDVPIVQPRSRQLWVPLAPGEGARLVRIWWRFREGLESLAQPNLSAPQLIDVVEAMSFLTLHVPPGRELVECPPAMPPATAVSLDLLRARTQLQLSSALAAKARHDEEKVTELSTVQAAFYRFCRMAQHRLATLRAADPAESLAEALRQIRLENEQLARVHNFENLRADSERRATSRFPSSPGRLENGEEVGVNTWLGGGLSRQGTPTYWQTVPGQPPSRLVLAPAGPWSRAKVLASLTILLAGLGLASLGFFPRLRSWVLVFWPEWLLLLSLAGWLFTGLSVLVAALLLLGLSARLVWLGRWLTLRRVKQSEPISLVG